MRRCGSEGNGVVGMELDEVGSRKPDSSKPAHPEIAGYIHLLVLILLLDQHLDEEAISCGDLLVEYLSLHNQRTLDEIQAQVFFFQSRAYDRKGLLHKLRLRQLALYRTATLHHDLAGQSMLINLLLRSYVRSRLYDQADKLISSVQFPESRSNNQLARYFYYLGRIRAIQLDYSESARCLEEASQKAPQSGALAFRTKVQKFVVTVQLLMGEIPERSVFRQPEMVRFLKPYLSVTQAVRIGDLHAFQSVLAASDSQFKADETYPLISRLHHTVIKAGLRKINISYSRISIADICSRLGLESITDTECIIAKAIRDGVVDGTIDHDGGFLKSRDRIDSYSTIEPTNAFHERIGFCLKIHNDAVRAMRFPEKREDPDVIDEARRERMKEEQVLAKTLAEEEDEDDDF